MRSRTPEILAGVLMVIAVVVVLHQHFKYHDIWFDLWQIKNHETLILSCVIAAIALLVGKYLGGRL